MSDLARIISEVLSHVAGASLVIYLSWLIVRGIIQDHSEGDKPHD